MNGLIVMSPSGPNLVFKAPDPKLKVFFKI